MHIENLRKNQTGIRTVIPSWSGPRESDGPHTTVRDRANRVHRTTGTGIRWSPQHSESGLPRTPPARKRRTECPTLTSSARAPRTRSGWPLGSCGRARGPHHPQATGSSASRRTGLQARVVPTVSGPTRPGENNEHAHLTQSVEVRGTGPSGMSAAEFRGGHVTTTTTRGTHMRCIDCPEPATHRGRCKTHHGAYEGRPNVRSRRARGRRRANRRDAAARLRRRVQERGTAWCDWCLGDFPADGVDVDHVRPFALGGEDVDSNVQVLCHRCHGIKTATEFGGAQRAA
ncbi:HNH endonuclease [Streptomyces sp. NPDC056937]|uniref:HNH endonuclease n=1 Tax=Streptomyces sp. NPDC056937 TaxID=3345969 RepID=UPI003634DBED